MTTSFLLGYGMLWLIVLAQGILVLALLGRLNEHDRPRRSRMPEGLLPGTTVPPFVAKDLVSGRTTTATSFVGQRFVVVFVTPECSTCRQIARNIHRVTDSWQVLLCCCAPSALCRGRLNPPAHDRIVFASDPDNEVAGSFDVTQFPTIVAVDAQGSVLTYMHPRSISDALKTLDALPTRAAHLNRDVLDVLAQAAAARTQSQG